MSTPRMNEMDTVYGALAECYVTIDGSRYNLMQLYEFESSASVNVIKVPILGKIGGGKKAAGWEGKWKGTAHYNQSVFRRWFLRYCQTGELTPFEIQVTNEDPSSAAGRQTITHTGCLLDSVVLSKFNADDDLLDEELSGTFSGWDMPEQFALLDGME